MVNPPKPTTRLVQARALMPDLGRQAIILDALSPLVNRNSVRRPSLLQDHRGPPHGLKAKILPKPWSPSSISLPPFSSVPYSGHAAESEDEDDIDLLAPSVVTAPWDKMLSLAEVARLRADGQIFPDDGQLLSNATDEETRQARNHPFDYDTPKEDSRKRRRSGIGDHKTQPEIPSSSPWQSHTHASQDPVELGLCTLQRGKQLFDLRSPFSITTIIMVGAMVEDGGGGVSELQKKCRMGTLFTPLARIEAVQAMVILSSFGDTSWRPGGHTLRMAVDMGLYRCLGYLLQTNMGIGKSAEQLEAERYLVVGARVWLAIYKMEYEMSYNFGRPAFFAGQESIAHCRRLLDHPLAVKTDSRLVAACELLTLRGELHYFSSASFPDRLPVGIQQPFSIWPTVDIPNLDEKIKQANIAYEAWERDWDEYYVITQRCHAILTTNSHILLRIQSKRDVTSLSEQQLEFLLKAIRSAETHVGMALRGEQYGQFFRFANHYTHVGVVFAARLWIRLTSLMPEAVNLKKTGRDVERLVEILSSVPGFQFAQLLKNVITKARQRHVLPPLSKAASPAFGPTHLSDDGPPWKAMGIPSTSVVEQRQSSGTGNGLGLSDGSPVELGPSSHVDFAYAEHLFSDNDRGINGGAEVSNYAFPLDTQQFDPNGFFDHTYNLETWFPFPPLQAESGIHE
ncbi:MAG: hypothetical protein TREMPRED_004729 [Tremellales sp. Tagirdzhanova-0007]|nr:MAG: hypothetical protein TREMPRED_004729 [Tremellales sp. Tagirdzhanova-0007]